MWFPSNEVKIRFFIEALFEILGLITRLQRNLDPTDSQSLKDSLGNVSSIIGACIDECEKTKPGSA
jgi:hypothetical protein